ncbi:hypothetical protein ACWCQZ_46535 [Streptomyces sp. NPDC002285]
MRFPSKSLLSGAAVFGILAVTAMAGAPPAAASSSCTLTMIKHQHWEGHTFCTTSRAGAIFDRIQFWGADSWPFGDHKVGDWIDSRQTPVNNTEIVYTDRWQNFNEDHELPYLDDEIYAKVFFWDPATNRVFEVITNTVSGDFA